MKRGIYPGSFDPVHKGHILIARETIRQGLADRVLMVPTASYWDKTNLAPLAHRIRMLQLFEDDTLQVETVYNKTASTYESFQLFEQRYPEDELLLIIGADNLLHFDRWIQYRKLLEFPFAIAARDDFSREKIEEKMRAFGKENYAVLKLPNLPVSSTRIRRGIKNREKDAEWIDERVYDYIRRENLYR